MSGQIGKDNFFIYIFILKPFEAIDKLAFKSFCRLCNSSLAQLPRLLPDMQFNFVHSNWKASPKYVVAVRLTNQYNMQSIINCCQLFSIRRHYLFTSFTCSSVLNCHRIYSPVQCDFCSSTSCRILYEFFRIKSNSLNTGKKTLNHIEIAVQSTKPLKWFTAEARESLSKRRKFSTFHRNLFSSLNY